MALNDVKFVKGQGGLGRPLDGEDHISGFVFYVADAALTGTGFSTTNRIKVFFSLDGAETAGILSSDSDTKVIHYHISEFFRIQPKGVLYVGLFKTADETTAFDSLKKLQEFANGTIRQAGIYVTDSFAATQVTSIQAIATTLATKHMPLSVLFAAHIASLGDLYDGTPIDLTVDTSAPNVSVIIGQDGNGVGKALFTSTTKSITCLGAALGAVSRAKVSENIGWVKNFNLATTELDVIAFADGTLFRDLSDANLDLLNSYHYIFLRKHIGVSGSYFNDSHTAVIETSDYTTIENNRTIDKAIRNIRTFVIPELNGPLLVNPADGTLSEDTIAYFTSLTSRPLEQMQRDTELSGFAVIINPAQDVLALSKLEITVKLVPVGVAREIVVNIGFTVKLS